MSMDVGGGEGGYVADINVTPMVDVMLVLLIIFMVIAPMLQSGVSVALPKSKYPDPDPNIIKDTSAVVAIPNNGEYYIGRDKIALADIPQKVKTILKDKPVPDQVVYVKSSKGVKYGEVVMVIDSIREAGFDRIGLVAEKEKQQGAPASQ
ncbi:MAG TPA: biopolymer transporter ExbD [Blastocatellia bacterium]|jgi:biopolymer transport protein ExbD|nr:biopolymer transporter ExbD [Blastocatellia bacterium]